VGWLYNGDPPGPGGFKGGFAYDAVPYSLSGYYKYLPNGSDTAMILVVGSYYDAQKDSTTDVFYAPKILVAANSYIPFTIPIGYDTSVQMINQLNIIAVSSINLFDHPERARSGTALYLDDLWLDSKCAEADTTQLFANSDTTVSYNRTQTPIFSMDTNYRSYLWSTGDTTHSIVVTSDPLNISVTVTDSNGCELSDDLVIHLNLLVNIVDPMDLGLNYFPNPVGSQLSVEADETVQMSMYTVQGKLVKHLGLVQGSNRVDLTALQSGPYVLVFTTDNGGLKRAMIMKE
jgi:hypothetical protein